MGADCGRRLGRWLVVAALALGVPARGTTITYTDFSDLSGLDLNGDTDTIHGGGSTIIHDPSPVLRLTNDYFQSGSAFVASPIALTSELSFSAAFVFRIRSTAGEFGDGDGAGADGLAFVVQTVSSSSGGAGGGLGYDGLADSVGVEFDTYDNGMPGDINGNHVGIDLEGSVDSEVEATVVDRMNDGDLWYAWVDYDGTSDGLSVRLNATGVRPVASYLDYTVDLTSVLGSTDAFVGFTSGTGSGRGLHDILSFTFVDDYSPVGDQPDPTDVTVPEPGSLALLSLGLVALRRRRRR